MQRNDNSIKARRDPRLELRAPAVERVPPGRYVPQDNDARASVEETVAPRRAIVAAAGPGPVASRPPIVAEIRRTLASRGGLRRALLLNEILGLPVALRDRSE